MGILLELFRAHEAFAEGISTLKKIRDTQRKHLNEYEYATLVTLIRAFEQKKNQIK